MLKNLFLVSCAVLAVSGLPYYAQDIAAFLPQNTGLGSCDPKTGCRIDPACPGKAFGALCDRSSNSQRAAEQGWALHR